MGKENAKLIKVTGCLVVFLFVTIFSSLLWQEAHAHAITAVFERHQTRPQAQSKPTTTRPAPARQTQTRSRPAGPPITTYRLDKPGAETRRIQIMTGTVTPNPRTPGQLQQTRSDYRAFSARIVSGSRKDALYVTGHEGVPSGELPTTRQYILKDGNQNLKVAVNALDQQGNIHGLGEMTMKDFIDLSFSPSPNDLQKGIKANGLQWGAVQDRLGRDLMTAGISGAWFGVPTYNKTTKILSVPVGVIEKNGQPKIGMWTFKNPPLERIKNAFESFQKRLTN